MISTLRHNATWDHTKCAERCLGRKVWLVALAEKLGLLIGSAHAREGYGLDYPLIALPFFMGAGQREPEMGHSGFACRHFIRSPRRRGRGGILGALGPVPWRSLG